MPAHVCLRISIGQAAATALLKPVKAKKRKAADGAGSKAKRSKANA